MNKVSVLGSAEHWHVEESPGVTVCGIQAATPFPVLKPHVPSEGSWPCFWCAQALDRLNGGAVSLPETTSNDTETTVVEPEVIQTSMSTIALFQECRRKYMYQEVRGWYSRSASWSMVMGTAYHAALAAGYRAVRALDDTYGPESRAVFWLNAAEKACREVAVDRDGKSLGLIAEDRALLKDMVTYWFEQVGKDDLAKIKRIISVEEPYYVQIGKYLIRCTLDLNVEYADLGEVIIDHKTGDPQRTKDFLALDIQTSTYYIAKRGASRSKPVFFSHHFMDRDVPPGYGSKPLTTATGKERAKKTLTAMQDPSRYIGNEFTTLSDSQLDAYTAELVELVQEIDHATETNRWPRRPVRNGTGSMSCDKCPYFAPCTAERDGRTIPEEIVHQMFIVRGSDEWQKLEAGKIALETKR